MRPFVPLLVLAGIVHRATAHMELILPPAVRSKSDPQTVEADKDYSMTAPLAADGSNFPAKKYATKAKLDALKPVATLVAGQEFSWNLGGTAVHNGGSCQVAVSYDLMETMIVIASWVGGCPLSLPYKFKVPDLPGCDKCFFIWSWFNRTGNREMYQNAAVVSISGKAKQFVGPQIYRINTFGKGVCSSAEGIDIVFPAPGDQVFYANGMSANSPVTEIDCPDWDNKKTVTVTGPGNGPTATSPSGGATGVATGSASAATASKSGGAASASKGAKPTGSSTASEVETGAASAATTAGSRADADEADDSTADGGSSSGSVGANNGAGSGSASTVSSPSSGLTGLDRHKTMLFFGGGFVLLLAVAAGLYCLLHWDSSGYRETSSDDDSESAYRHAHAHRRRSPRRHSRRKHRHEKHRHDDMDSLSSSSSES